mmetsp:Transcript_10086/g.18172  ORF Transcript_10086/g.18172 Transcript_10086/m.18172 type:complete len:103 (-) Transcript_10086:909-1217(-)
MSVNGYLSESERAQIRSEIERVLILALPNVPVHILRMRSVMLELHVFNWSSNVQDYWKQIQDAISVFHRDTILSMNPYEQQQDSTNILDLCGSLEKLILKEY